jgi:nucleoside-diphosphate-sugar epimerase
MTKNFRILLLGATGWLGKSLVEIVNANSVQNTQITLYGRLDSTFSVSSGKVLPIHKFDLKSMGKDIYDCFAPYAFLTRDKSLSMSRDEYVSANRNLIEKTTEYISSGNVGSVINLSSGVVTQMSEVQSLNGSYSDYANLKLEQEERYAEACRKVGVPFINCRVFSLTGEDMTEPWKYAVGDIVKQALESSSVVLNSKSRVLRRYMDARDLNVLLLNSAILGSTRYLESSGSLIDLLEFSNRVLMTLGKNGDSVRFNPGLQESFPPDIYYSKKNDMEQLAEEFSHPLKNLDQQISSIIKSVLAHSD